MTDIDQEVEDLEQRLQLATEVEVFDVGIEVGLFLIVFFFTDEDGHTGGRCL